jgi:hypothetical protein
MSSTADPDAQAQALFVPHGDGWAPTELSRGPWDAGSLHGGPVAALMVRELERIEAPAAMRLARVTVELLRPVPLQPLQLTASVLRPGRKVALVEAELRVASDGTPLALARGLRIREAEVDFPDPGDAEVPELPAEPDAPIGTLPGAPIAYHSHGVEHRFLRGSFGVPGPMFDWTRLRVPVVPGEEPTPWQRAVAVADFGNGLSALLPFDGTSLFVNPDLTVHLSRAPVGEWIGLDASTRTSSSGIGLAETDIWDLTGRLGRGLQSLYLERF